MSKYTDARWDLEYSNDVLLITGVLKRWRDARPDNPEINAVLNAFVNCCFYTNRLSMDKWAYDDLISSARYEKNLAHLRAKECERKIAELESIITKMEEAYELR